MVHKYSELDLMQARIKEVPKGWNFLPIAKAFKIRNDLRKPISDEIRSTQQGLYPYYGPTKIQDYIDTYEQDGSFALIGEDGDHFLKYKSQSMTQLVDGKCTVNNHAHIIEGTDLASREWFYYYFMHRDIYSYLSRQGAGRYKLNKASLEKIYVLTPPSEEQNKIAQILSTWDQAISATEKLLENSQQQKKALMQQLLTGKKRLLDENGVSFSEDWHVLSLDELFFFKKGKGLSKDMISESGQNKCILYGQLYTKYLEVIKDVESLTDSTEGTLSMVGDILIPSSTTTSGIDLANATALLEDNVLLGGDINILRPKGNISSEFMAYLLTHIKKYEIASRAQGITIIHLYGSDLKGIEVKIPKSIQEQNKISELFSFVEHEIEAFQKKLDCLKQEKKALMQQLLTGKKRVKVAA